MRLLFNNRMCVSFWGKCVAARSPVMKVHTVALLVHNVA